MAQDGFEGEERYGRALRAAPEASSIAPILGAVKIWIIHGNTSEMVIPIAKGSLMERVAVDLRNGGGSWKRREIRLHPGSPTTMRNSAGKVRFRGKGPRGYGAPMNATGTM